MRTVASQMADARGRTVSVRIGAEVERRRTRRVRRVGPHHRVPGLPHGPTSRAATTPRRSSTTARPSCRCWPRTTWCRCRRSNPRATPPRRPPATPRPRSSAGMEELSVGRPSTYASIIGTIQDRDYVRKRGSALVPTWTAFAVTKLLEHNFRHLVDYEFTAHMEDDLDEIAKGHEEREPWLRSFWFGNGQPGLARLVDQGRAEHRPGRGQLDPHRERRRRRRDRRAQRPVRAVPAVRRAAGVHPRRPAARRAHASPAPSSCSPPPAGRRAHRRRSGHRPAGLREVGPLRSVCAAR